MYDGTITTELVKMSSPVIEFLRGECEIKVITSLYHLGMEVTIKQNQTMQSQSTRRKELLEKFNVICAKP